MHQAAQQARTLLLGWGVDSRDWTKPGAATIVSTVLGTVTPGAIILLHDAGGTDRQQTIAALPGVIDGLQAAELARDQQAVAARSVQLLHQGFRQALVALDFLMIAADHRPQGGHGLHQGLRVNIDR